MDVIRLLKYGQRMTDQSLIYTHIILNDVRLVIIILTLVRSSRLNDRHDLLTIQQLTDGNRCVADCHEHLLTLEP